MKKLSVLGLAAAASLSVLAIASEASASTTLTLNSSSMDTNYTVNLTIPANGAFPAQNVTAYSNGVLFDTSDGLLYGFCFDVYHDMYLGTLNLSTYTSNESDGGGLAPNSPQTLTSGQTQAITNLVDTGWLMFQGEAPGGFYAAANADTEMRLAAIQAAIWYTENNSYLDPNQFSGQFKTYFDDYTGLNGGSYTPLNTAQDKVFTISNGANQSFAIGWPIAAPEPATWALMLTGFFGMGALLRRQRKAVLAA
ncbi:MAG: PEP-CTERM sorting domain-containing protein [Proteobacteria bacterium]|nr:PEP-CTERM sorting domain-containing protein [Pseudomonadota bacterium]